MRKSSEVVLGEAKKKKNLTNQKRKLSLARLFIKLETLKINNKKKFLYLSCMAQVFHKILTQIQFIPQVKVKDKKSHKTLIKVNLFKITFQENHPL